MTPLLYGIAACLMAAGVFASVVPALPGIPLAFAGIWLAAGADHYEHIGLWWLLGIGAVGAIGLSLDLLAGALGAKHAGASSRAACQDCCSVPSSVPSRANSPPATACCVRRTWGWARGLDSSSAPS